MESSVVTSSSVSSILSESGAEGKLCRAVTIFEHDNLSISNHYRESFIIW